jgi:acetyl esterase/lipase
LPRWQPIFGFGSGVGDEVQEKSSGDTSNATVLGLAHCAMLFAPAELRLPPSRRLQYFPDSRLTDLAQTGMSGGEELRLKTADGETLVAWYFPPKDGRPLILYFHGNGGALVDRVPRFRLFTACGYGVLAVSYRGYGGSTGSPTETG